MNKIHVLLFTALSFLLNHINSMQSLFFIPNPLLNYTLRKTQSNKTSNGISLVDIPLDVFTNYIFSVSDNIDYPLIKLTIMHITDNEKLIQYSKTILNEHIKPLLNLAATCNFFNNNSKIRYKIEQINPQYIPVSSIYKARNNNNYIEHTIKNYNAIRNYGWFSTLCTLEKTNCPLPESGYKKTYNNLNYQYRTIVPYLLIKIYVLKEQLSHISFNNEAMYQKLHNFCEHLKCNTAYTGTTEHLEEVQTICNSQKPIPIDMFQRNIICYLHYLNCNEFYEALNFFYLASHHHKASLCFVFSFFKDKHKEIPALGARSEFLTYVAQCSDEKIKNVLLHFIQNNFNENKEKTDIIISTCNKIPLTFLSRDYSHLFGDWTFSFAIDAADNQPKIPLDLIQLEYLKVNND